MNYEVKYRPYLSESALRRILENTAYADAIDSEIRKQIGNLIFGIDSRQRKPAYVPTNASPDGSRTPKILSLEEKLGVTDAELDASFQEILKQYGPKDSNSEVPPEPMPI